jgi:hypothetical protein
LWRQKISAAQHAMAKFLDWQLFSTLPRQSSVIRLTVSLTRSGHPTRYEPFPPAASSPAAFGGKPLLEVVGHPLLSKNALSGCNI